MDNYSYYPYMKDAIVDLLGMDLSIEYEGINTDGWLDDFYSIHMEEDFGSGITLDITIPLYNEGIPEIALTYESINDSLYYRLRVNENYIPTVLNIYHMIKFIKDHKED